MPRDSELTYDLFNNVRATLPDGTVDWIEGFATEGEAAMHQKRVHSLVICEPRSYSYSINLYLMDQ
jgi:hypothetical protein